MANRNSNFRPDLDFVLGTITVGDGYTFSIEEYDLIGQAVMENMLEILQDPAKDENPPQQIQNMPQDAGHMFSWEDVVFMVVQFYSTQKNPPGGWKETEVPQITAQWPNGDKFRTVFKHKGQAYPEGLVLKHEADSEEGAPAVPIGPVVEPFFPASIEEDGLLVFYTKDENGSSVKHAPEPDTYTLNPYEIDLDYM